MQKPYHIHQGKWRGLAGQQQPVNTGVQDIVPRLLILAAFAANSSSPPKSPTMPFLIVRSLHNSNVINNTAHYEHWVSNYLTLKTWIFFSRRFNITFSKKQKKNKKHSQPFCLIKFHPSCHPLKKTNKKTPKQIMLPSLGIQLRATNFGVDICGSKPHKDYFFFSP